MTIRQGTAESIEVRHGESALKIEDPSLAEILALGLIATCLLSGVIVWLTRRKR